MLVNSQIAASEKPLPDVANRKTDKNQGSLSWVGMDQIDLPLNIVLNDQQSVQVHSKINCYVSLDNEQAKGIHMSRLYRILNDYAATYALTPPLLKELLSKILLSHEDLSCDALVSLSFDLPLQRSALLSDNQGWKFYPVEIKCQHSDGEFSSEIKVSVPYSSTCPCSASLSRQLLAEKIQSHFASATIETDALLSWITSDAGSVATPHSQRSWAYIKTQVRSGAHFPLIEIINAAEGALKTPVQTAVKREDEQEFARLNGENLMFCEDAARRIKTALKNTPDILDFWFKVEHQESLHPHNAVAIAVADIPGGYQAIPEF